VALTLSRSHASLWVCRLPPRSLHRSPALTGVSALTLGDRGRVLVAGARPPAAGKDQGEADISMGVAQYDGTRTHARTHARTHTPPPHMQLRC
jgi:hypothetical protein